MMKQIARDLLEWAVTVTTFVMLMVFCGLVLRVVVELLGLR
jgi:hypothetical protein